MRTLAGFLLFACLGAFLLPAQASWGDTSYDPNPSRFDLDKDAQFDSFELLMGVLLAVRNDLSVSKEDFESGFTNGQQLSNWVGLGSTRARFGFASSLDQIQWQSRIARIDPRGSQFGLTHPHGTYGNASGILDNARNYVVDHYFLTGDSQSVVSGPGYFVIQFQTPVSFIDYAAINYAPGTRGAPVLTLWNGETLSTAIQVNNANGRAPIPGGTTSGDISYFVGEGYAAVDPPYVRPTFNFVVLSMDTSGGQVGFDNFTVGMASVPEPDRRAMLLAGLGMVGLVARRVKPASI